MLPTHNLQSFGGGQGAAHEARGGYDPLAGTVPRPEPERLGNVWREREDGMHVSEHDEMYKDSLRMGSRVPPASNHAPFISNNMQTMPIAT